ncbi:hypothetical protein RND81_03G224300 [Saponaria officinalis]|uniref:Cytochrome P450 n=1 Tax=Saponaria officinalis TaxID=3572 RepID=A0AAW1MAN3_SAPOF
MSSQIDTFWVLALATKFDDLTVTNIVCTIFVIAITWLVMTLFFWTHPGGPAWGKYYWPRVSHWAKKPIPGPRGWPIIGSMGLKIGLAHHKIAAMAQFCGAERLMAFTVGETRMIVTCNPEVAKEILNSPVFVDRPDQESAYGLMFDRAIGFAPYGSYWRTLRRIASTHMFSPKQIKSYETQRSNIVNEMVQNIKGETGPFRIRELLKWASLSNMMGSVFGVGYSEELKDMVDEGYDLLGVLNLGDHLPWLSRFDFQKVGFRCSRLVPKVNRFVGRIIEQHRSTPSQVNRDFVDVLLSLQGQDELSNSDMIAVLWEMIFRGTDSMAVLMEWILARLVLHPEIQSKVHAELDKVVCRSRAVTESDLPSLTYLTAVIKEVLRLHPPGPLLAWARLSIEDTLIHGYHVPKGTTAMVNMWAIARDPHVWADPLKFKPERFVSYSDPYFEFSVLGSDLRLAPFGSGKRACPGKKLGLTAVTFWVASLLHEFEWMMPVGDEVDMSDVLKLSCEMAHPLTVRVKPRRVG